MFKNGNDQSKLSCLLVGKSYGSAQLYKFAYDNSDYLMQFHQVAIVHVDTHEPGFPGDNGREGKWYDYVYFEGSHYQLKFWKDKFEIPVDNKKIAFFNIFQRNVNIKGYSYQTPAKCINLTGKKVTFLEDRTHPVEEASHENIANCDKTSNLIQEAVQFLMAGRVIV